MARIELSKEIIGNVDFGAPIYNLDTDQNVSAELDGQVVLLRMEEPDGVVIALSADAALHLAKDLLNMAEKIKKDCM